MDYKIVVTAEAQEDLNQFIQYLLFAKKNKQAAKNVLDDFEYTIKKLKYVASSLKVCDNPRLQSLGYRRINFQQHRYFMLYRIENDVVYVDDIFHELQDYSHILDDDRRKNAELFEEAFYEKKNLDPQMHVQQENNNATVADEVDPELLAKVLANPEMRALLNSLAKTMK